MRYTIPISAMTDFDKGVPWRVDPRLPELYELPRWCKKILSEYRPQPEPHAPQDDGRAVRFQDSAFFYVAPTTAILANRWYPVAEFVVPSGHYGWIYRIDTHVWSQGNLNSENDPLAVPRSNNGNFVYWRLMIEPLTRRRAVPHGYLALAGQPLPGFNAWNDGRYAWGNQSGKISILVPERQIVRLYAGTTAAIDPVPTELGGRLVGVTASYELNPQAIDLLRSAS